MWEFPIENLSCQEAGAGCAGVGSWQFAVCSSASPRVGSGAGFAGVGSLQFGFAESLQWAENSTKGGSGRGHGEI